MNKIKQKFNSFDRTVEMMKPEADSLFLSSFDKKNGLVCGQPCDSKTGTTWSLSMLSSIEEAMACKYPKVWADNDEDLNEYFEKLTPR